MASKKNETKETEETSKANENREILLVADVVSNEKGVEKEVIFDAIEAALAQATKKKHGGDIDVKVNIDRETGGYESFRRWTIMDDEDPEFETTERQTLYSYAIRDYPDVKVGDTIDEPIEAAQFGRIAAQAAKQVIVQKVREAERNQIAEEYADRVGTLIMGVVKRTERRGIFLDMGGNAEGFIPREQMIPRESARPGDRLRGYLIEVSEEVRGPQLIVSRTSPEFLVELFKLEVPEVGQELIEILSAARDPGLRAKIAVVSNDPRLDPVGACVGMRGSRVQTVSNELAGERVDIILHDENPAQFVIQAMSPAEVLSIVVDEERHSMDIAVEEEKLSQAIGKGGQNIKLASELTGWNLNVMSEGEAFEKSQVEMRESVERFTEQLDVDEEVAVILVQEGFTTVDEVAYVPEEELLGIDEFEPELVTALRARAQDALLTKAIALEEVLDDSPPAADLLEMEGMDEGTAMELAANGICSMEDLAEQAVEDIIGLESIDEERAGVLIMKAREPWFAKEEAGE